MFIVVFEYVDDEGMLLFDFKDFCKLFSYMVDKEVCIVLSWDYGNVVVVSVGVI